jgi:hypothetical protein
MQELNVQVTWGSVRLKQMLKKHMSQLPDTEDEEVINRLHLKFKVI